MHKHKISLTDAKSFSQRNEGPSVLSEPDLFFLATMWKYNNKFFKVMFLSHINPISVENSQIPRDSRQMRIIDLFLHHWWKWKCRLVMDWYCYWWLRFSGWLMVRVAMPGQRSLGRKAGGQAQKVSSKPFCILSVILERDMHTYQSVWLAGPTTAAPATATSFTTRPRRGRRRGGSARTSAASTGAPGSSHPCTMGRQSTFWSV